MAVIQRTVFRMQLSILQSLPHNTRLTRTIAIEIAQLYLVQGQLRLAAEICDEICVDRCLMLSIPAGTPKPVLLSS